MIELLSQNPNLSYRYFVLFSKETLMNMAARWAAGFIRVSLSIKEGCSP